jgi:hypothetical protein
MASATRETAKNIARDVSGRIGGLFRTEGEKTPPGPGN